MGEHHDVHFLMVEDKRNIIVGYDLTVSGYSESLTWVLVWAFLLDLLRSS